ncbi:molybdopterin-dependent oxidoreductase [Halobacteriovorax sp. HLS]|uniref:molybdopterin-dependent oxidoreductase n=1 Tax=Halobacteriovorax sp. HLS TaxID=2234000 RepID=UPI000FDA7F73|nr:molybdopterin-dependent oxidoreductase [Halobacteriovorax sp. HLS]
MFKILTLTLTLTLTMMTLSAMATTGKVPRQKVYIEGNVKEKKVYKMDELSDLPTVDQEIIDPYTSNKKIKFTGIYLSEIFKIHGNSNATSMEVIAINDYKVTISKSLAASEKMILAFKGDGQYLTVSQRGPARIVIPGKGLLSEGELAKEGINWVWFVKRIIIK